MALPRKPIKGVNVYREGTLELWKQAVRAARNEHPAENPSEGQVLAEIAAAYIGTDSPLEGGDDA